MATGGDRNGTLPGALRQYAAGRFSGVLLVRGRPGATIYLTEGRIAGCETPGAPSLDVILLRSRRISASDWEAARDPVGELVRRGLLGAGEAEALLRTALADAIFALVSGSIDGWEEVAPVDCPLPLRPAASPGWLLAEAGRRARVLASFADPAARAESAATADGPGSARDLAFAQGRGLYETMLQLARIRAGAAAAR